MVLLETMVPEMDISIATIIIVHQVLGLIQFPVHQQALVQVTVFPETVLSTIPILRYQTQATKPTYYLLLTVYTLI